MKLTRDGLLTAILVLAALFVGSFISEWVPHPDRILTEQPFPHNAPIGETVHLRTAEVTVADINTAKRIEGFGEVSESSGVWLLADIVWSPLGEPRTLGGASVVIRAQDGREFGGLQTITTLCGPTQPGIAVSCQIAIEVAPDALEGAHLLIPADGFVHASDDLAVIDLGIDAAKAADLAATDTQVKLLETTAVAEV